MDWEVNEWASYDPGPAPCPDSLPSTFFQVTLATPTSATAQTSGNIPASGPLLMLFPLAGTFFP